MTGMPQEWDRNVIDWNGSPKLECMNATQGILKCNVKVKFNVILEKKM